MIDTGRERVLRQRSARRESAEGEEPVADSGGDAGAETAIDVTDTNVRLCRGRQGCLG